MFVREYLGGNGKGIDVFPFNGLSHENVVEDITRFPFVDNSFDSVTFIACINHIPSSIRDVELAEAYRCLKPSGNIIVTMGNPVAEILVHKLIHLKFRLTGSGDEDSQRGMHEEEAYYLTDTEIILRWTPKFGQVAKRESRS